MMPLDLLGEEQKAHRPLPGFLDAQINAGSIECGQAEAHLEDCIALAGDRHAIYMSIDGSLRHLADQAFFDGLVVLPADTVAGEPGEPFNVLFAPDIQRTALARQRATKECGPRSGSGLNDDALVDLPKRFSNKRPALNTLIRRVLRGSEGRGSRGRGSKRHDTRGPVAKNPAKPQTRLTPERRAELVADYEAGLPVRTIAAKYGVHRGTIPTFVSRAGASLRTAGLDDEGRARAAAFYTEGLTLQEVAERLDVDSKTVRNAVLAEGGQLRPRGRRAELTA